MANQLTMAEVQAILALVARSWSYRRIGRELGVDRQTVANYARRAADAGSNPAMALTGFLEQEHGRAQLSAAWPWRETIQRKLDQGLSVQRIYQDAPPCRHFACPFPLSSLAPLASAAPPSLAATKANDTMMPLAVNSVSGSTWNTEGPFSFEIVKGDGPTWMTFRADGQVVTGPNLPLLWNQTGNTITFTLDAGAFKRNAGVSVSGISYSRRTAIVNGNKMSGGIDCSFRASAGGPSMSMKLKWAFAGSRKSAPPVPPEAPTEFNETWNRARVGNYRPIDSETDLTRIQSGSHTWGIGDTASTDGDESAAEGFASSGPDRARSARWPTDRGGYQLLAAACRSRAAVIGAVELRISVARLDTPLLCRKLGPVYRFERCGGCDSPGRLSLRRRASTSRGWRERGLPRRLSNKRMAELPPKPRSRAGDCTRRRASRLHADHRENPRDTGRRWQQRRTNEHPPSSESHAHHGSCTAMRKSIQAGGGQLRRIWRRSSGVTGRADPAVALFS